jgi:hypothetical protein
MLHKFSLLRLSPDYSRTQVFVIISELVPLQQRGKYQGYGCHSSANIMVATSECPNSVDLFSVSLTLCLPFQLLRVR